MAININLLPAREKILYHQRRLDSKIFFIGITVSIIVIGAAAALFFYLTLIRLDLQTTRDQIDKNNREITTLKPIHEKYSYLANNIKQIEILKNKGIDYEQIIREISAVVPNHTMITSLNFSVLPAPSVNISATASTRREGFVFYEKMKATPRFANTVLQSFSAPSDSGTTDSSQTKKNQVTLTLSTTLSTSSATSKETNK